MRNVTFPQIYQIFQSYVYHIAKDYLPLFHQIIDLLKQIGLVGTMIMIGLAYCANLLSWLGLV